MATVSQMDQEFLQMGREHITRFLRKVSEEVRTQSGRLLEIGPQHRNEARELFSNYTVDTLDIVDTHNPTYLGDITKHNDLISDDAYDGVLCMDVIEHTLDPFGAVREIHRILKGGGFLLISAPLNFRIHGPIPDCWRFTEHGFKVLLREFELLELDILEAPHRDLFPIRYNIHARKDARKRAGNAEIEFRFIT
jgi:SAM-dependent methyltransferase